jgi:hypothetical protein
MKILLATLAVCSLFLSGCAGMGTNSCVGTTSFSVSPTTATVDHLAASPADQQQFIANTTTTYPKGCAIPAFVVSPYQTIWTSSDPVNAPIDSTFGQATDGVATCKGATTVPVTLTAFSGGTSGLSTTATLVCK